jgi:hypothetical protein
MWEECEGGSKGKREVELMMMDALLYVQEKKNEDESTNVLYR